MEKHVVTGWNNAAHLSPEQVEALVEDVLSELRQHPHQHYSCHHLGDTFVLGMRDVDGIEVDVLTPRETLKFPEKP